VAERSAPANSGGNEGRGDVAQAADAEPLKTTPLRPDHRITDFRCERSERVQNFFHREMPRYMARGYCRVLILPDPTDPTGIWGYYTLTPSSLRPEDLTNSQRRRVIGGIPIPMMLIGFMGRDDRVPKEMELGSALLVDAARVSTAAKIRQLGH
jgi:hypothetical protein